jgi:AraC family transcriptional regulator, regulatory protein of adaptative response / methylphosphotriester-DNA alkyltransferase methyltransferase
MITSLPLSISHRRGTERRVVVVSGEISMQSAPWMSLAFAGAARAAEPLALDLSRVAAEDDGAMPLLVNGVRRLHRRRRDLVLVCPAGPVRTALGRAGVAARLRILDDWDGPAGPPLAPAGPGTVAAGGRRRDTLARRGTLLVEATLAIERRHADPTLGVDDVAHTIATSTRQLQRVLAEIGGSTFRHELGAVRMQHAAALLQSTRVPVAEIAGRVGYRQPAQFAKAFRRHHGAAPSAFRRAAPNLNGEVALAPDPAGLALSRPAAR